MLAALLLFCVGILIPASASPVRICFLELGLNSYQADSKCCPDCNQGTEQPDPCCHDLEELPDAPAPQLPLEITRRSGHGCAGGFVSRSAADRTVFAERFSRVRADPRPDLARRLSGGAGNLETVKAAHQPFVAARC